ncbi:MAG: gluconate 2-dehydrogenase subunit 3 family protein [Chitinophagaceae bacterium]|nr:gluconate 2-dehydrogenase subunit 3 family protein [Chitinophagaceae bacterium]
MDRRKSLKLIAAGAIATPVAIAGCKPGEEKKTTEADVSFNLDRNPDELKYEKELLAKEQFFSAHEMATIAVLADIIIPKDEKSGNATDAKVPEFIEFIVKDMPSHQVPMKGGLRWMDVQTLKTNNKAFKDCTTEEQLQLVDKIAYPDKAKPEMSAGVKFFTLMRNLTATGFYTSQEGVKDIGYVGNTPNQWNGVPEDVLQQYKLQYTQKELDECVSYNVSSDKKGDN